MTDNVRLQGEVKGSRVGYHNGSELIPLSSEGLRVEKRRRRLSLSEVDITAATSESGSNRRSDRDRGGIVAARAVGLVVGKGGGDNKGVPHGRG